MGVVWHDATIPIHPGMTIWPGDPSPTFSAAGRIANGDACNISEVSMGTHTGTHVDAPWHVLDDAARVDALDASLYFGEALLLDLSDSTVIHAETLGPGALPKRLLIKTDASRRPVDAPFRTHYVALEPDAAERVVREGVGLIGIDSPSIGPYGPEGEETHRRLLRNNVIVVEGLRLEPFARGSYLFSVLPLPLQGMDGAPCRAFVGIEEERA